MARKWNWKKKYGDFSVQQLLELLNDDSFTDKYIPTYILGELKAEEAVPKLIKNLDFTENEALWTEYDNIATIFALGKIKDKRAVKSLTKLLENKPFDVITTAAWALGEIGDKGALPDLEKALENDEHEMWWSAGIETADCIFDEMFCDGEGESFIPIFNYIQDITFKEKSTIEKAISKLKKK